MRRALSATILTTMLVTPALAGPPIITFEQKAVVVEDVTPGGRVAIYGVAHDFRAVLPELLRWARELADEDRDGSVTFELPRQVPTDSQWFVVDVSTGALTAASPRGDDPRERPFDGPGIVDSHAAARGALRVRREMADVLVVRPGAGSWLLLAGDGAGGDADETPDGFISGELANFQSVSRPQLTPAAFAHADVAIVVDPFSLEYSILSGTDR